MKTLRAGRGLSAVAVLFLIATHLRVQNPLFTHTLFPVYVALFVWGGLFLRDAGLRAFFPWRVRQ